MPPQGGQCPYCQLIDNPDQLLVIDETEHFYAWLEIQPRAKGHTQIVPKEHVENVFELEYDQYQEMSRLVRRIIQRARDGLGADGISVTMNVEEAGGQMLPHMYVSVFPRFADEENAGTPTGAIFPQRDELQEQLQDIQQSMSSVSVDFSETREPHEESQKFKDDDGSVGSMLDSGGGTGLLDGFSGGSDESDEDEEPAEEPEVEDEDRDEEDAVEESETGHSEDSLEAMSNHELFMELVSRYESPDRFIDTDEFQEVLSSSSYTLKKVQEYRGSSFDWQ